MPREVETLGTGPDTSVPRHLLYPHKAIISDRYYLMPGTSGEEGDALIQTGNYRDEGDMRRYEVRASIGAAGLDQTDVVGILVSPKETSNAERNISVLLHGGHKVQAGEDVDEKDPIMAGLTGRQGQVVILTGTGVTMIRRQLGWMLEPADSGADADAIINVRGF